MSNIFTSFPGRRRLLASQVEADRQPNTSKNPFQKIRTARGLTDPAEPSAPFVGKADRVPEVHTAATRAEVEHLV
jgi:hypothetical protein